jgi:uncharacterized protein
MMNKPLPTAASRLCSACGMCCNGVLFQAVSLQASDSVKELKALGLRLKTKRNQTSFPQPCLALRHSCCAIYEHRPQRCRLFNCQQLMLLASGQISEEAALGKIQEAHRLSSIVKELLLKAGSTNQKRSLATRYELVLAQPVESLGTTDSLRTRHELVQAMENLENLLVRDFRGNP